MNKEFQVRLSGFGGQGIILAGIILGEAVSLHENRFAVQFQSYGPEARGGASRAEVVISDEEIDLLELIEPDVFLALSQQAFDKYIGDAHDKALVIVDTDLVPDVPPSSRQVFSIPISKIAHEQLGKAIVINMVALGALAAISGLVGLDALKKAISARVPPGTEEINLKAVQAGYESARKLIKK